MSRPTRIAAALCAAALLTALAAVPAAAAPAEPRLTLVRARLDARVVEVLAVAPEGAASLTVLRDSAEVTRVACVPGDALVLPVGVPEAAATIDLEARDASGAVVGSALPLTVRAAQFKPTTVTLNIAAGRLLVHGQRVAMASPRATRFSAKLRAVGTGRTLNATMSNVRTGAGTATLPHLYGRDVLTVTTSNAWGSVWKAVTVWHLDVAPGLSRYIVVDKSDFMLYRITEDRVHSAYPVAIGMPGTPTRTGTFVLGSGRPAGGVWGPYRIPLYVRTRSGLRHDGYYIHGTNEPDSIGTEASHGCVRMFNSDIRKMLRLTWSGMRAVIRS